MPHLRSRHAMALFQKRLRFSRVVTIQGPRQCGKSVFARQLFGKTAPRSEFETMDVQSARMLAQDNPQSFLLAHSKARPLIIDEAQKAPPLFDAIKAIVDENSEPGQFVLLGSTEFSRELRIKESLTGRMLRTRLFTLTLRECLEKSALKTFTVLSRSPVATRPQVMQHLDRGGFPGIFAVREPSVREELLRGWLEITVTRDLQQLQTLKLDAELAMNILYQVAQNHEPTAASVAAALRKDTRTVQKYLKAFETLFILHRLDPVPGSTGKPRYYLCDVSLAGYLGGSFERRLETWVLHELMTKISYLGAADHTLGFYRNTKGSLLHWIVQNRKQPRHLHALRLVSRERFDQRDTELLKAFEKRQQTDGVTTTLTLLGPNLKPLRLEKVEAVPWESVT